MISKLLTILILFKFKIEILGQEINCDLVNSDDSNICNLNTTLIQKYKLAQDIDDSLVPFELNFKTSSLTWLNKRQPTSTRWSKLCPSVTLVYSYQQILNLCSNYLTCDQSGVCVIKFSKEDNSSLVLNLKDNVNKDTEKPMFTSDLSFMNVTFDLETSNMNDLELILIESTSKLDSSRSKPNRVLNEFKFDLIKATDNEESKQLYERYCSRMSEETHLVTQSPFSVRFDKEFEKLYIKLINKTIEPKQQTCFLYNLVVKRPGQVDLVEQSSSLVMVNLNDNRYDHPIFDYQVYNFTIYENSPLNTIIGQVHAIYLNKLNEKQLTNDIKYRIVPFVSFDGEQLHSLVFGADSDESSNSLPVKINTNSGLLTQKLNIDREKYLTHNEGSQSQSSSQMFLFPSENGNSKASKSSLSSLNDGLIKLNIESSYMSMSYGYCKVNIFIKDINDNPPVARIRAMGSFGRLNQSPKLLSSSPASQQPEVTNFYVNEQTPINQILAYVGVYDPDAGENGTIKSIDLTLINLKRASNSTIKLRQYKLDQLKEYQLKLNSNNKTETIKLNTLINNQQQQLAYLNSNPSTQQQIPFKLNKIGDKLFTLQLVTKLDFKLYESYSVEMRIQDNGTMPQLESKTRINLNVLDSNDFTPVFINVQNEVEIMENVYEKSSILSGSDLEWPVVYKFNAIDLDDDKNGQIKYTIVNNPFINKLKSEGLIPGNDLKLEARSLLDRTFSLNKDNGELKLLRAFNRDELDGDLVELVVMAQDQCDSCSARLNSTFKLSFKILDQNNNLPKLDQNEYKFSLEINANISSNIFKQVASSIYLIDLDTYETNSFNYININLNKTTSILKQGLLNTLTRPKFIFKDEKCLKTFNLNLSDNSLPFLFMIEAVNASSTQRNVKCMMSIWLDTNKLNEQFRNESFINFKFEMSLEDYGVPLPNIPTQTISMFSIEIQNETNTGIDLSIYSNKLVSLNQTSENKFLFELNINQLNKNTNIFDLVEFELKSNEKIDMKSNVKLYKSAKNNKIKQFSVLNRFKLEPSQLKNRHKLVIENIEGTNELEGVYFIDLVKVDSYIQIQLIIYNVDNHQIGLKLLKDYEQQLECLFLNSNTILNGNALSYFEGEEEDGNKGKSIFDGSLSQFQSLLFGANSQFVDKLFGDSSFKSGTISNLLFSNKTTLIQFIVVTIVISLVVFIILIFCVLIIIRKNCVASKKNKNDKNNKESKTKPSSLKNLNVIDDESLNSSNSLKFKTPALDEDDNGGFTRVIINNSDKRGSKMGLIETKDESKDKVSRYLDGLESHYQTAYNEILITQNQIEIDNYLAQTSSSEPTSSSPSSSIIDSKKGLIIPVDYHKENEIKALYSNASIIKNQIKVKIDNQPNQTDPSKQHSVCTLSTTSSSCMSDEGCYGSSDFSSERESNGINKLKQISKKPISTFQPNLITPQQQCVKPGSRSQTPSSSILNSTNQSTKYQQTYINNLTRFEKIYNNKTDLNLDINTQEQKQQSVQLITTISGSYV